jgi:23S rRNA pseudouridine1911/1915/1917 synthase
MYVFMPTEPQLWKVEEGSSGLRLDRFLMNQFPVVSRVFIQDLVRDQLVRVNGKNVKKGQVLHRGDRVEMDPFLMPHERRIEPNSEIGLAIVFESRDVLVLNKPPGLPTHPNDFADRNTLANAVLARFPETAEACDEPLRPGIVHRLDTNTSGLILIARTPEAFAHLRKQFDERKVKKTYTALVLGEVIKKGEVSLPVAHHATNPRRMVAVREGVEVRSRIREATTLYKPIEKFSGYSLLEVRTLTGRMHQVRVHLSAIGHPLVGDRIYQSKKEQNQDGAGLCRHFLHASELSVKLPGERKLRTFRSDLADDLKELLLALRSRDG